VTPVVLFREVEVAQCRLGTSGYNDHIMTEPDASTITAPDRSAAERLRRELTTVDPVKGASLLQSALTENAGAALRDLDSNHQARLLEQLGSQRRTALLTMMPPDERARMLSETDSASVWLDELPPKQREDTRRLAQYPPESVGRMMTPRFLELAADESVGDALDRVRRCEPDVEAVYRMPVVDDGHFVGMVSLRDLLRERDDAPVASIAQQDVEVLSPTDDQEVAARRILTTEDLALPVVDNNGAVIGVVTIDDAMEVLQLEEAEDAALSSGTSPLRRPYLSASLFRLVQSRVTWLVAAAAAGVFTVQVLDYSESELEQVVALALFIPLLLGTGGNIGAQATTTVVRAMAVDDLRVRDLPRVVWREIRVGVMLGGLLAALAATPITIIYEPRLALVVCLTLVSVCIIGTAAGSALPLAVGRLGGDPAVVSAPFITTLVDATGLLVYFLFARIVFGL
jgi:magnesium transporter